MPTPFATENDTLNGISMMFATLLTGKAPAFHDVRTYWSPDAVKRVTGKELTGYAKDGIMHLINSGKTLVSINRYLYIFCLIYVRGDYKVSWVDSGSCGSKLLKKYQMKDEKVYFEFCIK